MGGWTSPGQKGVAPPSLPPCSGTRRHLHTFRLARRSPFRPPRFQLLIWKRKKKPAGWGGRGEVIGAAAPPAPPACGARCRRIPALPRPGAPPTTVPAPGVPAPSRLPLPAPKPGASLAGPGVRTRAQTAAPLREERGPCGEGGRGPRGGRSPREPSRPGSPPSPEEPRLVSASSASPSEPKLSPAPPRGSSSGPAPVYRLPHQGSSAPWTDRETESHGGTVHSLG